MGLWNAARTSGGAPGRLGLRRVHIDACLDHLFTSPFDLIPAQGHDVPDAEVSGSARLLDRGGLGNVVEPPVSSLEKEVAPIPQLVGEPRPDDPSRHAGPRLDGGDDDRQTRIGQMREVPRPARDDVPGALRLPERGLHPRQEPPRPRADLLGEPQTF